MAEYVEREKVLSKAAPVEGCFSDMISAYDVVMLPTADVTPNAVPIEELEHLRNELYEHDLITMEGLKRLNTLIKKYTTAHEGDANNG